MNQEEQSFNSVNLDPQPSNTEIKSLLEENLVISREILDLSKYMKGYIFWRKIIGFIQLLVIVIPIILAVIYLPPYLRDLVDFLPSAVNFNDLNLK